MKSSISLLLCGSFLISACGKTIKEGMNENLDSGFFSAQGSHGKNLVMNIDAEITDRTSYIQHIRALLNSKAPNIALAELLAKTMPEKDRKEFKDLIETLDPEEIKDIIEKVEADNMEIHQDFLFHGHRIQNNDRFLNNALTSSGRYTGEMFSLDSQMKMSAAAYLKNKALEEIITSYHKRSEELANDLAEQIAFEFGKDPANAEMAAKIEASVKKDSMEKTIEMLKKTQPIAEKIDAYFKHSQLSQNEQYTVMVSAAVLGGIYLQVKDNESFKKIVEKGTSIVREVTAIQKKAKELSTLVATLAKHFEDSEKNAKALGRSFEGMRDDFETMTTDAVRAIRRGPQDINTRKITDFLYNNVIRGKKGDDTNVSIFSKPVRINEHFKNSVDTIGKMSQNLSNIIQTSQNISKLLGVKLPKDVEKVLEKAEKVSKVVNAVQSVITGFATGGYLGALSALGSGPVSTLLGGGGNSQHKEIMDQLKVINQKLDMILENQRKIMEMQLETMKMIKDLAMMIDQYHQNEMLELAGLRSISLVTLEGTKALMNQDIRACERIIDFDLRSVWKKYNSERNVLQGITDLGIIKSKFNSNVTDLDGIRRLLAALGETEFATCQRGINEAFSGTGTAENPIRAIYSTNQNVDLNEFHNKTYLPLLDTLSFFSGDNFDSMALHLPSKNLDALRYKKSYIDDHDNDFAREELYIMKDLVSAKSLERYLNSLLLMYPFLELDKKIWSGSINRIVTTYLKFANVDANQNIRSYYYLTNALKLTQSAIAQEAVLAGEPLLHNIYEGNYVGKILAPQKCKEVALDVEPTYEGLGFICTIRNNELLMKNLLLYVLGNQNINGAYKTTFEKKDIQTLKGFFNANLTPDRFVVENNDIFLKVSGYRGVKDVDIKIKLPTPSELETGNLIYSENMSRLLMMQDAVIEALEKVTPSDRRTNKLKDELLNMILMGA